MTGKIKKLSFTSLFVFISFALIVNSYIFNHFILISTFLIFFSISLLLTKYGLRIIKKLKLLQNIREDGPSIHLIKKNTPTMGGIFILTPFFILLLTLAKKLNSPELLLLFFSVFSFFIIGLVDDYLSFTKKESTGLKTNEKFIFQTLIALFFIFIALQNGYINSIIMVSDNWEINSGLMIYPISFITLVGLSNAVNLTDGLDGLASGCSSIVFYGLGTEILLKGREEFIIYSLLCYAMSGLCMGFLKFNKYPAKIFMGDTGSLTIGATLGSISILTNSFFILFIISGIFVVEALSVIIQVGFFKITKRIFKYGKRIFLMAPIHHHFELKGIKEEKIVENFWKINTLLVILGIVLKINL